MLISGLNELTVKTFDANAIFLEVTLDDPALIVKVHFYFPLSEPASGTVENFQGPQIDTQLSKKLDITIHRLQESSKHFFQSH